VDKCHEASLTSSSIRHSDVKPQIISVPFEAQLAMPAAAAAEKYLDDSLTGLFQSLHVDKHRSAIFASALDLGYFCMSSAVLV
jgi:hypothetical protein